MTNLAVIDVETTGLHPTNHDRVIELAAVVIDLDGNVVNEFETLINPQRDIGPTQKHGLVSRDIIHAPTFGEIMGDFVAAIDGCVAIAGHNIWFDYSFLRAEFERCDVQFPDTPTLCTMKSGIGGTLVHSCEYFGVVLQGRPHAAHYDAMASAKLLSLFLKDSDINQSELITLPNIKWPNIQKLSTPLLTRASTRNKEDNVPSFLQTLINKTYPEIHGSNISESYLEYTDLLNRVLEDRIIDEDEGSSLVDLAIKCGLPVSEVENAHHEYLSRLAKAAWDDGVISDAEEIDLLQVRAMLGINTKSFESIMKDAREKPNSLQTQSQKDKKGFQGKRVCFTGACQCVVDGERVTKPMSYDLAENHGLIAEKNVTKRLDFLVVADPYTQSGKAKKARKYGTRIIQARVFWRLLGLEVT